MRLTILDGFRGFFLIFMMIIHTNMEFGAVIGKLNHHYLGWVEDAQGFVFISGFVVGLVYGARLIRRGAESCRIAVMKRVRTIYSHQAGLVLIFTLVALSWSGASATLLSFYTDNPVLAPLASLGLLSGSRNMGILPMYIWFMLCTPLALRQIHAGRGVAVLMAMGCAWLISQTGVSQHIWAMMEDRLAAAGHPLPLGIFFNLLGWQVVFFSGLYLGYLQAAGRLDLSFLRGPGWAQAALVAFATVVFLAMLDRLVMDHWFGRDFSKWFLATHERRDFTSLYVLAFALDLFLVTWLLVAGRDCGVRIVGALARLVEWIFTRPVLVFLGQHSLHVFSAHILLTYILSIAMQDRHVGTLEANLIVLLSPLPLYLAAWGHKLSVDMTNRRVAAKSQA